jgi:ribose transport system substrate-binding protein
MRVVSRSKVGLALAAAVVLALALAACGGSSGSDDDGGAGSTQAADASQFIGRPSAEMCGGEQYTIGFDVYSDTNPFAKANIENFKELASRLGCVEPIILIDNADPGTAVANINTFASRRVDAVVLAQVISAAQPGIMRTLDRAEIPAVATYVKAPGAPFISVDDPSAGLQGGKALARLFLDDDPDGKPYVIVGAFPDGGANSVARMDSFADGIEQTISGLSGDHIIKIDTKADSATANARTLDVLARIPKDAPILMGGINDEVTQGMLQATRQDGRDAVMAMGQGGAPNGLEFICKTPGFVGSVGYFPERWFEFLLPAAIARAQGKSIPQTMQLPTRVITKENIAAEYPDARC